LLILKNAFTVFVGFSFSEGFFSTFSSKLYYNKMVASAHSANGWFGFTDSMKLPKSEAPPNAFIPKMLSLKEFISEEFT